MGGGGGTTTRYPPSTPYTIVYYFVSATRLQIKIDADQSVMVRNFTMIWYLVSAFKTSKFMQQPHDLECRLQSQRKENHLNVTKVFKALALMLIFYSRSAFKTLNVGPHLGMFLTSLRCIVENVMLL